MSETKRPTVPALEAILGDTFPVLDHGFIRVIDYMGDDSAIVQAARVSYGKGTKKVSEDTGLIRYLMRHHHSTPFEMCEIKLHVKLPIFVARQWIRTRTANVNEISGRYSVLDREFYIPDAGVLGKQSKDNKQGRGDVLTAEQAAEVQALLRRDAEQAFETYESRLLPEFELARELARIGLPVSAYTQWYWKIDLHNLFRFLSLRADPHAQYEIRAYAEVLCRVVSDWVPAAYGAFEDYWRGATMLSKQGRDVVRRMLAGETVTRETSGMSAGEWREFCASMEIES